MVTLFLTPELRDSISVAHFTGADLWVGSDESAQIERLVKRGDGYVLKQSYLLADFFDLPAGPDEEIDIEGVTSFGPYLWVIGSHSLKRKKPKAGDSVEKALARLATIDADPNRYFLARLPLVLDPKSRGAVIAPRVDKARAASLAGDGDGNELTRALAKDPHIGPFFGIPGKDNGFDVEGLAAGANGRLLVGLRGPVLRGYAVILSFVCEDDGKKSLKLAPKSLAKHFVDLRGLGVRDLCVVGDDLLILAGPTMTLSGMVGIFRLKGGARLEESSMQSAELLTEISAADGNPEGLALISARRGGASVLVTHDSPGKKRQKGDAGLVAETYDLGWR